MDSKLPSVAKTLDQSKSEPRPYRNPMEILFWQIEANKSIKSFISSKSLNSTFDAHCCKISFEDLKPIKLSEMEIPKIHHGKYLVCRVIGQPIVNLGVQVLIQDLNCDLEEAGFYNFHYQLDDIDWISIGKIFVIKEPWLRYSPLQTPFLKIQSPSDIILVDPTDEKFMDKIGAKHWYDESASKDAEVWRQKANECFKNGKYEKALFLYDRGIRCNPDLAVLYLNKSLTCLKIGAFYDAYESAKLGLEKGGDRKKALYRMGQAAYGMREWQKSAKHFAEVLKEFPQNSDASKELKRATDRLKEQRTGKFDFKSMFIESKKERNSKLDVADYMGPIEIANIPGKGRGIIASTDIRKGTLLVVSKAVGSGHTKDFVSHGFRTDKFFDSRLAAQFMQYIDTIQYVKNNPQKAKEIYDLCPGDTVKYDEDVPFGVVDVARIERICGTNRFGYAENKFAYFDIHLFLIPSYFNHCCLANANRKVYGDVMIIHACTDIKKGEEISIPYVSALDKYSNRKEMFNDYGFTCDCKLCEADSKDDLCDERSELLGEFCEFDRSDKYSRAKVIAKGEETLKKIRETYAKRKDYKIVLAQTLHNLSKNYFGVDSKKCKKCLEELITLIDDTSEYVINELPVAYYILASFYYPNKTKVEEIKQKALETSYCTDFEHLQIVYDIPSY